ncbi:uncharacterized protein CXQ87_004539 [Candidozyma duobushaemuli]|uniref:Acid phosphatase n=2 Tax=Candidozyma TaxID=3303203 RepID=A0ABX8IB88_9ASCO|nr:uncharacterized protein CXQ87_004539 [[Candida] duobushaemulonis]PVH16981.1 hypothetical protein CXQ87_004539 [[Candida] duobushaemulonis]QWU89753.1 hypothetical protein CA3LBN_004101 [[Candida] haemuloni]
MLRTTTLLSLLTACHAAVYPQYYPPADGAIGNLDAVFDSKTATNGGIYTSSESSPYGTYNFCNMPHVRSSEYQKPEGQLLYVEVIHRHHKRTPYTSNVFPKEDIPLSCDSSTNFYYGQVNSQNSSAQVGWNSYVDPENPFADQYGFNGSCQFPQISPGGLDDSHQHGVDLFQNYHSLGLLPEEYDPEKVKFFATNNVITSQVAGGVVSGMYPALQNQPVEVSVQREDSDYLEPKYSCNGADQTKNYILASGGWTEHLRRSQELFAKLDAVSGVNPDNKGWHASWDHYFDNLAHRQCHQLPLPCNLENPAICVTEEQAQQVYRLGDYEYNYQYRAAPQSTMYSAARYGVFLKKLQKHLKEASERTSAVVYRHNVAHDGSIAPLLGALQIEELRWPGMGAEVVFELWERNGQNFVRVLYGGQPLRTSTPLGVLDMVSLGDFQGYLDGFLGGRNVVDLCRT